MSVRLGLLFLIGAVSACQQNCTERVCGPDPVCHTSCGSCNATQHCAVGMCFPGPGCADVICPEDQFCWPGTGQCLCRNTAWPPPCHDQPAAESNGPPVLIISLVSSGLCLLILGVSYWCFRRHQQRQQALRPLLDVTEE